MDENKLIEKLNWRYAVKKFDPTKKLNSAQWRAIEQALILSPSSSGLQPWKFVVVLNSQLRKTIRAASFNQSQVEDCSHYVILLAKEEVSEEYVQSYIDRMAEVRSVEKESLDKLKSSLLGDVVNGARSKWAKEWAARQCYIALGQAMTVAAVIGVDACPMEGFIPEKYDEILNLKGSGYYSVCALALGFRHPEDRFSKMKKVRFETKQVFSVLE